MSPRRAIASRAPCGAVLDRRRRWRHGMRAMARTMAAERRLSHDGWDSVVHGNATAGENIAYNYPTADAVMRGWLASPGHRANILRAAYHRIGVGCVVDTAGKRWWSQAFAD